jgi:solute carrier family 25 citrate transporter 1
VATGAEIVRKETALGLYKGLGAVLGGIIPKMAIRFTSYESYKNALADKETGQVTSKATFLGKSKGNRSKKKYPPVINQLILSP